jgi:hypothetical protein
MKSNGTSMKSSRVVLVLVLGLAAFTAATTTSGFSGELGYRGGERGGYERVYRYQGGGSPDVSAKRDQPRFNPNENMDAPPTPAPPRQFNPNDFIKPEDVIRDIIIKP